MALPRSSSRGHGVAMGIKAHAPARLYPLSAGDQGRSLRCCPQACGAIMKAGGSSSDALVGHPAVGAQHGRCLAAATRRAARCDRRRAGTGVVRAPECEPLRAWHHRQCVCRAATDCLGDHAPPTRRPGRRPPSGRPTGPSHQRRPLGHLSEVGADRITALRADRGGRLVLAPSASSRSLSVTVSRGRRAGVGSSAGERWAVLSIPPTCPRRHGSFNARRRIDSALCEPDRSRQKSLQGRRSDPRDRARWARRRTRQPGR